MPPTVGQNFCRKYGVVVCVHNGREGWEWNWGGSHVTTTYDTLNRAEGERERVQGSE